ncbi:MAG: VacJ family lipoprotein [Bdellovibrionales bacterium]|nr:VacJ family lipoprotein [Bdellovibrionales bacterium]
MFKAAPRPAKFVLLLLLLAPIQIQAEEVYDPLESVNRAIFSFNDFVDTWVLEPAAYGYRWVTTPAIRTGVRNFFINIQYPRYLISDLIQLKFDQAAVHTGRFVLNTTVGFGGVIDAADKMFEIKHHEEDIGVALGYWGVPSGAYLVLPIFGPSNVRDLFGRVGDRVSDPVFWLSYWDELSWEQQLAVSWGKSAVEAVTIRESLIEAVDAAKEASLDYYTFVRKSYAQQREGLIYDGHPPGVDEFGDDLEFEDDLDFDNESE